MRDVYIFEYLNEAEFKKRERSVKKYNMFAFKKLIFDFYPEMKDGNFIGNIVGEDKEKNTISYELSLPTDELFVKKIYLFPALFTASRKSSAPSSISSPR